MSETAIEIVKKREPLIRGFVEYVPQLVIASTEDYTLAGQVLQAVKAEWKAVEADRVAITGPMNAALKAANDHFRWPLETLKGLETSIKGKLATYTREAEEARVAAMVAATPVEAPPVAKGISVRTVRKFRVVDEDAVPRHLCSPDLRKISALPTDTAVPGVEWYDDSQVTSR